MLVLFIMKQTRSTGGIVVNSKGQILIVNNKEKISTWGFPKGHVKGREADLTTAKREIYEESGIKELKLIKEFESYKRYKINKEGGEDKSELKTIFMFLFSTDKKELKPIDLENPEARWVEKGKVVELLTHSKDKEFFMMIIKEV